MILRIDETRVETVSGPRTAWVVTPTRRLRVDRERLEAFREHGYPSSDVDRELLALVRATGSDSQLVVMRARDPEGEGSWGFEDDLTEDETHELGEHLVRDQLPMYRRMIAAGVFAILHVDFGLREVDAYQRGIRRVLEELEAGSIPELAHAEDAVAQLQADRWILHNLTFFFELSFDDVLDTVLRRQLPLLEERVPHLRQLAALLPR